MEIQPLAAKIARGVKEGREQLDGERRDLHKADLRARREEATDVALPAAGAALVAGSAGARRLDTRLRVAEPPVRLDSFDLVVQEDDPFALVGLEAKSPKSLPPHAWCVQAPHELVDARESL
jgi:hypothetical protein